MSHDLVVHKTYKHHIHPPSHPTILLSQPHPSPSLPPSPFTMNILRIPLTRFATRHRTKPSRRSIANDPPDEAPETFVLPDADPTAFVSTEYHRHGQDAIGHVGFVDGVVERHQFDSGDGRASDGMVMHKQLAAGYINMRQAQESLANDTPEPDVLTEADKAWLRASDGLTQENFYRRFWVCGGCSYTNPKELKDCERCSYKREVLPSEREHWVCSKCLAHNRIPIKITKDPKKYGPLATSRNLPSMKPCWNCRASYVKSLPGVLLDQDWVCKPCREVVKGEQCPRCQEVFFCRLFFESDIFLLVLKRMKIVCTSFPSFPREEIFAILSTHKHHRAVRIETNLTQPTSTAAGPVQTAVQQTSKQIQNAERAATGSDQKPTQLLYRTLRLDNIPCAQNRITDFTHRPPRRGLPNENHETQKTGHKRNKSHQNPLYLLLRHIPEWGRLCCVFFSFLRCVLYAYEAHTSMFFSVLFAQKRSPAPSILHHYHHPARRRMTQSGKDPFQSENPPVMELILGSLH